MTNPLSEKLAGLAEKALASIADAWVSNNSEGDDYDDGYDDGLKHCCDIARAALSEIEALRQQENSNKEQL